MEKKDERTSINKKIFVIIATVLTVVFILLALLLLIFAVSTIKKDKMANIFGFSFSTVVTGSMEPTIHVNDVIIIKDYPFDSLKEDDIIVYYNDEISINVVHRIIKFNSDGSIVTKGDNNPEEDDIFTTKDNYIGKVVKYGHFMGLGKFSVNYKDIIFVIIILAFIYIIGSEAFNISRTIKLKKEEELRKNNPSQSFDREKLREQLLKEIEEEMKQKNNQ